MNHWYECYFPNSDQVYRVWASGEAAAVRQVMTVICYSRGVQEGETPSMLTAKLYIRRDGETGVYEYLAEADFHARYKGVHKPAAVVVT